MKMTKKLFFTVSSLIIFCGWKLPQTNEIKKAEWLIGTWENKTSRSSVYETWIKISDDEMSGKSYLLKEKDTIVFETIRLVQEQGRLFYIPTVRDQNDGLPVRFGLKTISVKVLVFENPLHDFPRVISYSRISRDSLIGEISGMKNGQIHKQTFPMKLVK
jgi:hypothetical protein